MNRQALISAAVLGAFAVFGTGLLLWIDRATTERIHNNERSTFLLQINEIVPESLYDNDILHDSVTVPASKLLGTTAATEAYRARRQGQPIGIVFTPIAPNGYSGAIKLLVGIDNGGHIMGVRVLLHRETPGLGDDIEIRKSNWILQFNRASFSRLQKEKWKVKTDGGVFDAMTGATITSRAVVQAVKQTLEFYHQEKANLWAESTENQTSP